MLIVKHEDPSREKGCTNLYRNMLVFASSPPSFEIHQSSHQQLVKTHKCCDFENVGSHTTIKVIILAAHCLLNILYDSKYIR